MIARKTCCFLRFQIIDMGHPLVRLAALIDWKFLGDRFGWCAKPLRGSLVCRRRLSPACSFEAHAQPIR